MTEKRESVSLVSVRLTTRESLDPRATRTLRSIVDAVHDLAHEGATMIKVTDVIQRARIGKTTFYSHFSGIEELALHVFLESLGDSADHEKTLTVEEIVEHYDENRVLYSTVLAAPKNAKITATAIRIFADRIDLCGAEKSDSAHVQHEIVAAAILGTMNAWVRGELPASKAQLVATLKVFVASPIVVV